MGFFPIVFHSISQGLGDEWFVARIERQADGYWWCHTGPDAGTFQSLPPEAERNIPLAEVGGLEYRYDLTSDITAFVLVRVYDTVAVGTPIRGARYVNLIDGTEVPTIGSVSLGGPPYSFEAGLVFPTVGRRGVFTSHAPEIEGTVYRLAAPTFLGRIVDAGGAPIGAPILDSVQYSIFELSENDPLYENPVTMHQDVSLDPADVVLPALSPGYLWGDTDARGYNFQFTPDVATMGPAFAQPRRHYRLRVRFTPIQGQVFEQRYRVWAI
jgi:hypothetical protein